ncbi:MAG: N-acetyltransferase [Archangiaceae bacterium]|nr:N-acetyltransferase [Archangiaceae bacterium]
MTTLAVTPVTTTSEKHAFILFQYELYRNEPNFVPPLVMERELVLDPKKNPWFQFGTMQLFLARREGKVVGRIAAIDDPRYNEFHGTRVGWFGFFECLDDVEVAKALYAAAEAWVKARGLAEILGPASPSSNSEWGFLLEGFELPPAILMPWTPKHYLTLTEAVGYTKAKDLYAWRIDLAGELPPKVARVAEKVKQREGITMRPADLKQWDREVRIIKDIYNSAFERNWGFVPMTDAEFDQLGKDLKMILNTDLVLFAEVNKEPVAFCITVPDANQAIKKANGRLTTFGLPIGLVKMMLELKRIKQGRLIALGIKKEYRKRGLDSVLMKETFEVGKRLGWTHGEIGWTLEDNDLVNRPIELFGCTRTKRYRIYGKRLDALG